MSIVIKRAESIIEFCTDLAVRAEWEAANEALLEARTRRGERWASKDVSELATKVTELEAQMESSVLLFRLRAVPRKDWQEAVSANPPRPENEGDEAMGVDVSSFFDALLGSVGTIVSVTEKTSGDVVDFDPVADWKPLADEMTDGQYGEFAQKVFELNRGVTSRPFSPTASRETNASGKN